MLQQDQLFIIFIFGVSVNKTKGTLLNPRELSVTNIQIHFVVKSFYHLVWYMSYMVMAVRSLRMSQWALELVLIKGCITMS